MTKKIVDSIVVHPSGICCPNMIRDRKLWNMMLKDICSNNTFCPDIVKVQYNTKTEDWPRDPEGNTLKDSTGKKLPKVRMDNPILTTVVEFKDNTKVVVVNSAHDKISIVTDPETGAQVADEASKETGLVYAIVKKLIGTPTSKGLVQGNGFGRILRELVSTAYDQQIGEKKALLKKEKAKSQAPTNPSTRARDSKGRFL